MKEPKTKEQTVNAETLGADVDATAYRPLSIATGRSRMETKWKNRQMAYSELIERLQTPTRTPETAAEYRKMSKTDRDNVKDVGGFVGGSLKQGRRKAENLSSRSMITLDLDDVSTSLEDLWDGLTITQDYEVLLYTTHSHTARRPRVRLVIPLSRNALPDEYQAVARRVAEEIGMEMFDDTTYEPSRLMYWPSASEDGEYIFKRQKGDWLDVEYYLDTYLDWRDTSFWPTSSRQEVRLLHDMKKQEDPLAKGGIIGAFCRTYSISRAIDKLLPSVYLPTTRPDRYSYTEGSTVGGLVVYDDKFAFSHHGTDPASGRLFNAFDLVRVHMFGIRDEDAKDATPANRLPSFGAMSEFASSDPDVKTTLGTEKLAEVIEDFDFSTSNADGTTAGSADGEGSTSSGGAPNLDWVKSLDYDNKGVLRQTIDNAVIILDNDPRIKGKLIYNEFANRSSVVGKLPWSKEEHRDWADDDDSGVRHFLENKYGLSGANKVADAVALVFQRNKTHPVRDYLKALVWDKTPRAETLLTDYLGAEDSTYTRAVTRTHLVGAVARIMRPGCKYDTMLTLTGPQGIGKSTLIRYLGKDWFNDSIDTVKGKEAYEQLQGSWLIEMGELTATRKADIEAVKLFLSKTDDVYRVAYGRRTTRFKRQCVFWGTSNDGEFLRDKTGDRRYWPVDCMVVAPTKSVFECLSGEVDQIWAEAMYLYKKGHKLHLTGEEAKEAVEQQRIHAEDSPKTGMIVEYLDRNFPPDWEELDVFDRRNFLDGSGDDFDKVDDIKSIRKDKVCVMEVWCELFKGDPKGLSPILSREINDILGGVEGWKRAKNPLHFGSIYGRQRGYYRDGFSG